MDILRKIFGLQPTAPTVTKPTKPAPDDSMEGATAPLPPKKSISQAQKAITDTLDGTESEATAVGDDAEEDDGKTQQLPEMEDMSKRGNGLRIQYGQHTDVGQVRTNNQDAIFSFLSSSSSAEEQPEFGIFVVADGMGGHHDGEKASAVTVRSVIHHVSQEIFLPMLNREDPDINRPTIAEVMRDAVQRANTKVSSLVPEGGTTVTAAAIIGDLAYVGHVGDSRAYIIEKDRIEQITRDHSLVQRLIELEQLTPEEAVEHPQRNVLYRAIGQNETIDVDAITRRLMPGARLLICSDGLWNLVPEDELRATVQTAPNPQLACEALVKLANDRGGPDNISVILIKIPD